jgi:hypothetical protein
VYWQFWQSQQMALKWPRGHMAVKSVVMNEGT